MTRSEKLTIAQGICAPLLRKIRADLQRNIEDEQEEPEEDDCVVNRLNPRYSSGVSSPGRHVRTRSVVVARFLNGAVTFASHDIQTNGIVVLDVLANVKLWRPLLDGGIELRLCHPFQQIVGAWCM